jgi:hypothetical protein
MRGLWISFRWDVFLLRCLGWGYGRRREEGRGFGKREMVVLPSCRFCDRSWVATFLENYFQWENGFKMTQIISRRDVKDGVEVNT